jgi:hypothetical protein
MAYLARPRRVAKAGWHQHLQVHLGCYKAGHIDVGMSIERPAGCNVRASNLNNLVFSFVALELLAWIRL